MPTPRFAKSLRLRTDAFTRMAWSPSYLAPRAGDVLYPEPFNPPSRPTWDEIGAKDLVERDGRVESVSLSGRAFISLAGPLFESNPPREVRLVAVKWYLDELARCTHLTRVERLNLAGNRIGPAGMRLLAGSLYLRTVYLDLSDNDLGEEGVAVLPAAPVRQYLRGINLCGNGLSPRDLDRFRAELLPPVPDTIA